MYKIVWGYSWNYWVSNIGILWYICVDTKACIKYSTGVVNAPTDDEDCFVASQGEQKFVETVFKLWPRPHSECEDVSNNTNEAKDGDENSTRVVLVSLYNCHCQVCNILPTIPE